MDGLLCSKWKEEPRLFCWSESFWLFFRKRRPQFNEFLKNFKPRSVKSSTTLLIRQPSSHKTRQTRYRRQLLTLLNQVICITGLCPTQGFAFRSRSRERPASFNNQHSNGPRCLCCCSSFVNTQVDFVASSVDRRVLKYFNPLCSGFMCRGKQFFWIMAAKY